MKQTLFYLFIIVVALGCHVEDGDAPSPEEGFIKYYGELTSYEASDIEIVYDETGEVALELVVFGTKRATNGDRDYFVLRTDLDGNPIDSVSFGLNFALDEDITGDGEPDEVRTDEIAGQIEQIPGLGFVAVGTSVINENILEISDYRVISYFFLNSESPISVLGFDLIEQDEEEQNLDLIANDIRLLSNGNLLIVGAKEFDRGGGVTDLDSYFLRLSVEADTTIRIFEEYRGVQGDGEDEEIMRAFEKPGGNLVFIGSSNSPSVLGENFGFNGQNVLFLETDANATPINSLTYGFEDNNTDVLSRIYDEQVFGAIESSSGYAIAGTSSTSNNEEFGFLMNLSGNGIFLSGSNHDSSTYNLDNRVIQNRGLGLTQATGNSLVLLGQYLSFVEGTNTPRGGEGMFVGFDKGANPIEGSENFFGLSGGNDQIVDAVTLPDGKIVTVSNIDFGGGVQLISLMKLKADGTFE